MELRTQKLTAGHGGKHVINHLDLTLPGGKITALLGPNGCGKSTLLKCFSRLLTPLAGEIWLGDVALTRLSVRQLARRLALLPQQHHVPEGVSVRELVGYGRSPWLPLWGRLTEHDRQLVDSALQRTGIAALAEQPLTALSGGQRQRIMIARAIAPKPRLLMFDEATSALDNITQRVVSDSLNDLNCTRIVIAHRLSTIRQCDRILVLDGGKIVEDGNFDELLAAGSFFAELVKRQTLEPAT